MTIIIKSSVHIESCSHHSGDISVYSIIATVDGDSYAIIASRMEDYDHDHSSSTVESATKIYSSAKRHEVVITPMTEEEVDAFDAEFCKVWGYAQI